MKPAIISTNYDLVTELALSQRPESRFDHAAYCSPGFDPIKPDQASRVLRTENELRDIDDFNAGIPIIKLHGSVNWFRTDNGETFCHDIPNLLSDNIPNEFGSRPAVFQLFDFRKQIALVRNGQQTALGPEIVPPMFGKASLRPIIQWQWYYAIQAISRAQQIWIVGYSFPSTDGFMLRLLHEGLSNNRGLDWFVIADIQKQEDWNDRLNGMLNPVMRRSQFRFIRTTAGGLWNTLRKCPPEQWLART